MLMLMLWLVAWLLSRPTSAVCPPGHDLRVGVRRTGEFECWQTPVAPLGWDWRRLGPVTDWDGTYGRPERSVQPDDVKRGRVFCAGKTRPLQDGQRVWCG